MEETVDWENDDELPPAPPSPIQPGDQLTSIPEGQEQDEPMAPAPPTPPRSKLPATALWLGDTAAAKKPPPPEFREPLATIKWEEYLQRKAKESAAEPSAKKAPPKLSEESQPRSKFPAPTRPKSPPFKSPPPNAPPPPRGSLSPPRRAPPTPSIASQPKPQVSGSSTDRTPPISLEATVHEPKAEEGQKRSRSEAARPSFMVHERFSDQGMPKLPVNRFALKAEEGDASKRQRSYRSSSLAHTLIQEQRPTIVIPKPSSAPILRPLWPKIQTVSLKEPALPVRKNEELVNLTSAQVENEYAQKSWFLETLKALMNSRSGSRRCLANFAYTQANTLQLSFACFNMGNLARPPKIGNKSMPLRLNPMVCLWSQNWAHIIVTLEAKSLLMRHPSESHLAEFIVDNGLIGAIAHWEDVPGMASTQAVACHVRGDTSASVELLWKKRWPTTESAHWECVAAMFEIDFGRKSQEGGLVPFIRDGKTGFALMDQNAEDILAEVTDEGERLSLTKVKRAGLQKTRILAYHIESSKGGRRHENVRSYLKEILTQVGSAHVDLLFCDGNLAASRSKKSQRHTDIPNSTICQSYRQFQQAINTGVPFEERVQMVILDNNPAMHAEVEMTTEDRDKHDWDCCLVAVFGWGKTVVQKEKRIEMKEHPEKIANAMNLPRHDVPDDTSSLHYESAPVDWKVSMSERALHLDRKDMWLGNTDKDYHSPMFITLRNEATKNFRYRKAEKEKERRDRAKSLGHTASAKAAAAAIWASSASGANGCPHDDSESSLQPHEWRWSDYIMLLLFVIMIISTLVHAVAILHFLCSRIRMFPFSVIRRVFNYYYYLQACRALRLQREEHIRNVPLAERLEEEMRLAEINLRIAQVPADPNWVMPPPGAALRQRPVAKPAAKPAAAPVLQPPQIQEPDQEPVPRPADPPAVPGPANRRAGRTLWKFPNRNVHHFQGCHHLNGNHPAPAVCVGTLCMQCDDQRGI
jgi:hypothetical protein